MSLPERISATPSKSLSTALSTASLAADPSAASGQGQAPRFSALLDLHAQAAAAPRPASPRAPTPQAARAPASATPAREPATQSAATEGQASPNRPATAKGTPATSARAAKATAAAALAERQAADKAQARAEAGRRSAASDMEAGAASEGVGDETLPAEAREPRDPTDAGAPGNVLQAWLGRQPADLAGGTRAPSTADLAKAEADAGTGHDAASRASSPEALLGDLAPSAPGLSRRSDPGVQAPAFVLQAAGQAAGAAAASAGTDRPADGPALEGLPPAQGLALPTVDARNPAGQTATVEVALGTGPGQPDFTETFALHVRQLAQDGVQQATLHLHPVDLGSIAVQIAVDGGQAQVDFSASSAHTRELLGRHLDSLAQALEQAGLSLGGAQVREQAQGGGPRDGQAGQPGRGAASQGSASTTGADAPTRRLTLPAPAGTAGRLDLFA